MRVGMRSCVVVLASLLSAGCSVFGGRSGYEQPPYEVVEQINDAVEIRRYAPRLAAEAVVEASDERAGRNEAFRTLFDYISGANAGQAKVAMTTPVSVGKASEKIAMTTPVETRTPGEGRYAMRFFLPAQFTPETAPRPTDGRVRIVEVPAETVAVVRYSGLRDAGEFARQRAALMQALSTTAWKPAGEAVGLFYDPPWTLPFLRRNEIAVGVEAAPAS